MVDILTPVNYPGGPYGRDGAPYLLAAMPQPIRQDVWEWLRSRGLLYDGAPRVVPLDNWRPYVKAGWGGGGGAEGRRGPAGPPGPGFSEYQFVDVDIPVSTDVAPYVTANTLNAALDGGTYRVGWSVELQAAPAATLDFRVQLDGATFSQVPNYSETSPRPFSGFTVQALAAGPHTVTLEFGSGTPGTFVFMQNRRIEIWRVS